jgi:hypothetical protein
MSINKTAGFVVPTTWKNHWTTNIYKLGMITVMWSWRIVQKYDPQLYGTCFANRWFKKIYGFNRMGPEPTQQEKR